ncbi:probable peptidyl-tRNA hydrolase 2 [Drosophila sulfurigaster albostrigata]|uniref:probable peptidyl-tRNA hydrolase 2 n=1 Tax=Drosophila sulfurigaster albostrigata TaxID=89887 RepID=UPI002D21D302|nr:probable peptidyl-tRNA hydrolase 2 [Drosophila sulfurigaster albostrigata]
MGDKLLDTTQIINGLAVMISFFVGYKYALKRGEACAKIDDTPASTKEATEEGAAAAAVTVADKNYGGFNDNFKMVLVVRNDLKMGKGKIASQCSHGAVGAYQRAVTRTPRLLRAWEQCGCAKIAVRVDSEAELMAIKRSAEQKLLNTCLIRDAGRTQIEPNSKTVLAIGPAAADDIDRVTGHLKLL